MRRGGLIGGSVARASTGTGAHRLQGGGPAGLAGRAGPPPGTKEARDLLLKDPIRLTEADRESLHRFFRDRIEAAKADDTATSWEQQLAHVFDYAAWHQFVVKIDRANGAGWQLLTKKLHGALSGGEKASVLRLPLFAAVTAHYEALPGAPRLILLDEAFVGVDTTNRGQVFELLSALDLDLVLISDHEWCTYCELDGIATHQMIISEDGDDAVTTPRSSGPATIFSRMNKSSHSMGEWRPITLFCRGRDWMLSRSRFIT